MLQKQSVPINFSQGLDTKSDPFQVPIGNFLSLVNSVFNKGGLLQKRNGFPALTPLPDQNSTTLSTFSGSLLAIGDSLSIFSDDNNKWYDKGPIQPVKLSVIPTVRTETNPVASDTAIASNGLALIVYTDASGDCYYQIVDSITSQIIITSVALENNAVLPRAFALGRYLIVTYEVGNNLRYISIPILTPEAPASPVTLSSAASSSQRSYDGYVANNSLYLAFNASDLGGAIRVTAINSYLQQNGTAVIATQTADLISVTADVSGVSPVIWVSWWDAVSEDGFSASYNQSLIAILTATQTITNKTLVTLTSAAVNNVLSLFYQIENEYSYEPIRTDYIETNTITGAGTVGSASVVLRSVGLASKAFYFSPSEKIYMLATYGGDFQPTNFLIDEDGNVIAKLAYSNATGYMDDQVLPGVTVNDSLVQIGYLFKASLTPVNKEQGVANANGIYSENGVNLAAFDLSIDELITTEIGQNLQITGGFLWAYDGDKPVEDGFHLWPEDMEVTTATTGGFIEDQLYYYYFTYEWTDAQGILHRSAPSIPVPITTTGGDTSTNTINVPTLRLTYKTEPNSVRIVGYRWSTAQQTPYQFTSITSPYLNDPSVDSIAITDTLADSSILGNVILYTTGGVIENIAAPSLDNITLFKSRLFGIDAENKNVLWFSKQVIQNVPVEMSDLLTIYIAPTTGAQGSTGPLEALSVLDDKLILFKRDAIYYITGTGPDNTGANNDFSEPVFITATVGSDNQFSIVFMPQGLMFQSDKGIWLLGRDLNTSYIGAPVEEFTQGARVVSALNIPGTNQVRFTLDTGITLMYDYYYNQWGTFKGIPAISSTLYLGMHTYLSAEGGIFQETPDNYLDNSNPVLMSFKTGWINLAGLQGFERFYFFYLLASYLSPHKLNIQIAYDYNPNPVQAILVTPDNYNPKYGNTPLYGSESPYGGNGSLEQWRIFPKLQKCQSFQLTITEVFDASYGIRAGAGFTMSGLNLIIGTKSGYPRLKPARSAG